MFAFSVCIFIISCDSDSQDKASPKYFFDLKEYIRKQAAILDSIHPEINKTVTKDGQSETRTLQNIKWSKELQSFTDNDLNRPAWKGLYSIDTSHTTTGYIISYFAKDSSLVTRRMTITFEDSACSAINIVNKTKNNLYFSYRELFYNPAEGYEIRGIQDVRFAGKTNYAVKVIFID